MPVCAMAYNLHDGQHRRIVQARGHRAGTARRFPEPPPPQCLRLAAAPAQLPIGSAAAAPRRSGGAGSSTLLYGHLPLRPFGWPL